MTKAVLAGSTAVAKAVTLETVESRGIRSAALDSSPWGQMSLLALLAMKINHKIKEERFLFFFSPQDSQVSCSSVCCMRYTFSYKNVLVSLFIYYKK